MTLAEQVQIQRAEVEMQAFNSRPASRVECACGCGRWWYRERREGRPRKYATNDCWNRARCAKRRFMALVGEGK